MFKGSMVAMVTPLTNEQTLDMSALEKVIDFHLTNKTDALVVVGTTGEAATLSQDEKSQVIRAAVEQVNGKIPVIAGTAAQSTQQTIDNTKQAQALGVDGVLVMTPAYIKPPQRGLIAHYKALAFQTDLPIILYNVPGRTAVDLLPESVQALSHIDNIVAIKEASGSLKRAKQLIKMCGGSLDIISGDDALNLDLMRLGAVGAISVTANIAARQMHEVLVLALKGRWDEAKALDDTLAQLHETLFIDANPIATKWALSQMGLCLATLRAPLSDLESHYHQVIIAAMQAAGILKGKS